MSELEMNLTDPERLYALRSVEVATREGGYGRDKVAPESIGIAKRALDMLEQEGLLTMSGAANYLKYGLTKEGLQWLYANGGPFPKLGG